MVKHRLYRLLSFIAFMPVMACESIGSVFLAAAEMFQPTAEYAIKEINVIGHDTKRESGAVLRMPKRRSSNTAKSHVSMLKSLGAQVQAA